MAQPAGALAPTAIAPRRDVLLVSFAAFLLLGWTALLVPSLIREVQAAFGQPDSGMGLAYLLNSLLYVAGTLSVGMLAGRVPRRLFLAAGAGLIAAGAATIGTAGTWPVFLGGYVVMGLGGGVVDAGVNALVMDLYAGRAAMLNRLHLFFALGALGAPLVVGRSVAAGVPWQAVVLGTAVAGALVAAGLATRVLPAAHGPAPAGSPGPAPARATASAARRIPAPLVLLSLAIACYVAMELGISSWLVRYLEAAPLEVATLALSLFWGALGLGRLVSSFLVDRMGAVGFATTWAALCGVAILAALVAPSVPLAVACFAVAGFAAGPVYPVIMAIGGALYPGYASRVSSVLASAAIAGSIVYPPLMGVVSEAAGLWLSMLGAAAFAFASAGAVLVAARLAGARRAVPA